MRRGFTLIEVLTVIAIIGILASLGAYTYATALTRSRDSQRIADLQFIRNGLEQFYVDKRSYPNFDTNHILPQATWQLEKLGGGSCQSKSEGQFLAPKYMTQVPQDPTNKYSAPSDCNSGATSFGQYLYYAVPKPTGKEGFYLMARMERIQNVNYVGQIDKLSDYESDGFLPTFCDSNGFGDDPTNCSQNYFVTNSRNN